MEIGLGVLRFTPAVFWNELTLPELFAAIDGYSESQGGNREERDETDLTDDDRDDLLTMMETHRTPETKQRLKETLARVKQMAAEKQQQRTQKVSHAHGS